MRAQEATPVKVEAQKTFNVVGIAVRTNNAAEAGGSGEIPKIWQRFVKQEIAAKIPNRADQDLIVVNTDYQSDQNGEYTYLIGARVTSTDDIPPGLTLKEIPEGRYAVIPTDKGPFSSIIPKAWQRIWAMSAKELGGDRAFQADYEVYPPGFDPQNAQITIHIGLK
jgi:predicted transcriptional regulator YdeE